MAFTEVLQRDQAIKRIVTRSRVESQAQPWGQLYEGQDSPHVTLESGIVVRPPDLARLVGLAYEDYRMADGHLLFFEDSDKQMVRRIVDHILDKFRTLPDRPITDQRLLSIVEKTLLYLKEYEIAKILVIQRSLEKLQLDEQVRLIRRNGQIVPWNSGKIEVAVRKAFLALKLDSAPAVEVARAVEEKLADGSKAFVHIEEVQDMVQQTLMERGLYKAAEAYILYRARRDMLREMKDAETEQAEVVDLATLRIVEDSGRTSVWDGEDLRRRIEFGLLDLPEISLKSEEIERELRRSIFDGMSRHDLNRTIILNAKAMMELDSGMNVFAGRILLSFIYEEVLAWSIMDGLGALRNAHRQAFHDSLRRGVDIGRLNPRLLEYDLKRLADAIDPSSDWAFDYLGVQTLYDRYLIVDKVGREHRRIETPQLFWMRVAMGLFVAHEQPEDKIVELYNLYRTRRFCSSTPTLFNSGTMHSQLSSCYLYWVDDSIESIMLRGITENAFLSKWAGGLGGSWTSVRGTGAHISGTNGESQGVIPFLKLHNDQLVAVNQGGKRKGAGCAYLETWHNDLSDFLELRRNTGDDRRRTHDMNTANWVPDLFMKRMEARENWTFFRSNEVKDLHHLYGRAFEERYLHYEEQVRLGLIFGRSEPAIEVWKRMLRMIFETGHPWITFKDACNVRSPQDHCGVIHSSNLCTEITLNTGVDETAVCNLGSVVLEQHITEDGRIDHRRLRETVRIAVRALDNVIDINFYPTEPAKNANMRHRPVGLGVMGLQNALYKLDIPFGSDEAVQFSDEFMEAIAFYAYEASSDLAAEKGTYSSYRGSKWDRGILPQDSIDLLQEERGVAIDTPRGGKLDWQPLREKIAAQGMRNSNVLAIAPTATIANIMGSSPCIEPTYKNLYVKSNLSGDFIVLNQYLVRDLKAEGLWNAEMRDNLKYFDGDLADIANIPDQIREKYSTAFEVPFEYLIDAAARRQKWIDQSQSLNLFLDEPDLKSLSHMYRRAWSSGLKTTYYLRTLGASNIEKATVSKQESAKSVPLASSLPADGVPKVCSILDPDCEACQ
jgi:ribonucleoside-diphosphate reductase alpha chain